jgi:hypothetical protein
MTSTTPMRISFTSARPWRWIAADLLAALELAEIREPGAARNAGKDIDAIVTTAIRIAREP